MSAEHVGYQDVTITAFKDIDRNQIVMTIRESEATEQTLATVRRNLDQAIAAANHKTKTDLAAYRPSRSRRPYVRSRRREPR